MRILITGITGAVGSELAPQLLARGHQLRGLTRDPQAAGHSGRVPQDVELVAGDATTGAGLDHACADCDVAYYLLHSMEHAAGASFADLEQRSAENFARAAGPHGAGIRRIIYLGAMEPPAGEFSAHMASRLRVEQIVTQAADQSVALRASIVIGPKSRSFRLLVRLIERMPVLILPEWQRHRTAPVDQRDVTAALAAAADTDLSGPAEVLDLAGPDIVSYGQLIQRICDLMLVYRPVVKLPDLSLTPIASRISALIAQEQHELVGPLMESLRTDLLPTNPDALARFGRRRHSLNAAIEHALAAWEAAEPLRAR
ncbi:MAG: NAD(P)H-binding protein [Solirubrobacteraceae bacterium]